MVRTLRMHMPQSLTSHHIHLVFSTKGREPWIHSNVQDRLHAYIQGVLGNLSCRVLAINSMSDHIHILFHLHRLRSIAQVVEEVKVATSKWMKSSGGCAVFRWQTGYGAFVVEEENLKKIATYIKNQAEHHRTEGWKDEYRAMLKVARLEMDERYVWD